MWSTLVSRYWGHKTLFLTNSLNSRESPMGVKENGTRLNSDIVVSPSLGGSRSANFATV